MARIIGSSLPRRAASGRKSGRNHYGDCRFAFAGNFGTRSVWHWLKAMGAVANVQPPSSRFRGDGDLMTQLGLRPRVSLPEAYKGFHVVQMIGRVFGFPEFLNPDDVSDLGRLVTHPAVLS